MLWSCVTFPKTLFVWMMTSQPTQTHTSRFLFSRLMFIRTIISSVDRDASSSAMNKLLMLT